MDFIASGPLRRFVGFQRVVQVEAGTVHEGLEAVCRDYPDMRNVLFDASGRVRPVHRLALNDIMLQPGEVDTLVAAQDTVQVLTPLAGG